MAGQVELWLIRHGETAWSLSGAHTGSTDIPLTQHGRVCAEELRDFLRGVTFARVLVSPMARARETCNIAGFESQATIDEGLREWDYGEAEGKTTAQMREKYGPQWGVWTSEIIGGEALDHVGRRADAVIDRALAGVAPHGKVALFAHAHILRILTARWIGLAAAGGQHFTLGTGSVSVLGYERETRTVNHWNRGFED